MFTNRVTRNVLLVLLALLMIQTIIQQNGTLLSPIYGLVHIASKSARIVLDSALWAGYTLGLGFLGVTPLTESFIRYLHDDAIRYVLMVPSLLLLLAVFLHFADHKGGRNIALVVASIFIAVRVALG